MSYPRDFSSSGARDPPDWQPPSYRADTASSAPSRRQERQRQPSGSTMSGYHLRSRAGGLLASGSNYLATRDWSGMASTVKQKVSDAGAYAQQQRYNAQTSRAPPSRSMSSSSAASFQSSQANQGLSSLKALRPGQENPVLLQGWVQRNVARDRHPQSWSTPDKPEDLEDGEIEFQVSIDGFVAKTLDAPTRSQRLFNQMARQLAALPRLPTSPVDSQLWDGSATTTITDEPVDMTSDEQTLAQTGSERPGSQASGVDDDQQPQSLRDKAISKLMEGADEETLVRLMENIGAFPTEVSSAEAASNLEGRTLHHAHRQNSVDTIAAPPGGARKDRLEVPPGGFSAPSRSNTASSTASTSSLGGSLYWADRSTDDLHRLHRNLGERLRAYWIYRSGHRDVNIEIAPVVGGEPLRQPGMGKEQRLLLAATRLTTDSTGQYSHRLVIPWHMISNFCNFHSSLVGGPREIEALEVRAVLPSSSLGGSAFSEPGSAAALEDDGDVGIATPWLRYPLTEDGERRVRVISDIDDTVKHTGVLQGTKRILRNVFVLPFEEVEVPGVAEWYQRLVSMGVGLHYVTNAPLELHRLVGDFFRAVNLPPGSLTLKHYPSGTRSLLASWLEPAGERKRANVVKILDEFPRSRFILVGDSGELDLELYTSLAVERPEQVRGIFIRDVSSPRPGVAKSPTTTVVAPLSESGGGGAGVEVPPSLTTASAASAASAVGGHDTIKKQEHATRQALQFGEKISRPPPVAGGSTLPSSDGSVSTPSGFGADTEAPFFQPSYPPPSSINAFGNGPPSSSALPRLDTSQHPVQPLTTTGGNTTTTTSTATATGPGAEKANNGNNNNNTFMTETDLKRKQAFQSRLLRATASLPRSTVFRLFYEGADVQDECMEVVRRLQGEGEGRGKEEKKEEGERA